MGASRGLSSAPRFSTRAPDNVVRPIIVALLTASGLGLLITSSSGLAWALGFTALVGLALWGAVDATLHLSEDWQAAGFDRTTWVAIMGIGAPVGIGFVASALYAVRNPAPTGGPAPAHLPRIGGRTRERYVSIWLALADLVEEAKG